MSLKEQKRLAWKASALLLGGALPLILMGRAVMGGWLIVGIIIGLTAMPNVTHLRVWKEAISARTVLLSAATLVAFGLSTIFSLNPEYSLTRLGELAAMAFGAFLLYVVLRDMPTRMVYYSLKVMAVVTIGVMVLALIDAYSASQRLATALHGSQKWDSPTRLAYLSDVLAVLLPYMWVWLLKKWRDGEPLAVRWALPLSVLGFVAVFICGNQSGWMAVSVAAVLFLLLGGRWHGLILHTRHWVGLPFLLAAGPVGYGLSRGWDALYEKLNFWRGEGTFVAHKLETWQLAAAHLLDSPITGIGVSAYRFLPVENGNLPATHPHNFALQLMLETGLLGTVCVGALILSVFIYLARYAQVNVYGMAGLCSVAAFFVASLAGHSIFQPWWLVFFIFSATLGVRLCRLERKPS